MLREKNGRVTFMPLNRLKPKQPTIPPNQDALPLLEKLSYDSAHGKAFQQVFGKTWVCRDLTVAAAYVKSHGVNTITLDGDKVDRKGALTGGYHDVRRSRIEAVKNVATWRSKFEAEDKRAKEVKAAITTLEQEITKVTGKIQVLSVQQAQAKEAREVLLSDSLSFSRERERLSEGVVALENEADELETELSGIVQRLQGYRTELASPLTRALTDDEANLIDTLGQQVDERRKRVLELSKSRIEVGALANSILNHTTDITHSLIAVKTSWKSSLMKASGGKRRSCRQHCSHWVTRRMEKYHLPIIWMRDCVNSSPSMLLYPLRQSAHKVRS